VRRVAPEVVTTAPAGKSRMHAAKARFLARM